jgi:predicted metal-dependent HD superfamily phosphohydrolase/AcrR family transcriptional regulator
MSLLAREGWGACTMEAIGREAGLSAGLVNYHFATKQDLLLALVDQLTAQVRARADAVVGRDPWSALDGLVDACLGKGEGADPTAVAAWTALGSEATRAPEIAERYASALRGLHASFEAAMDACAPGLTHAGPAATTLASIEGAFRMGTTAPGILPEGKMAALVRDTVHATLRRAAADHATKVLERTSPFEVPPGLAEIVVGAWSARGRWYHDPLHLAEVLQSFARETWEAPREIFLALLFHDAIYVPGRSDNEAQSAALAGSLLPALIPGADTPRVQQLILLTAAHGQGASAPDNEAAKFLDVDLAILGAKPAVYDRFAAGVAREYGHVPREAYTAGRVWFLDRLLAAPRAFNTDAFEGKLGRRARTNMERERAGLVSLSSTTSS